MRPRVVPLNYNIITVMYMLVYRDNIFVVLYIYHDWVEDGLIKSCAIIYVDNILLDYKRQLETFLNGIYVQ